MKQLEKNLITQSTYSRLESGVVNSINPEVSIRLFNLYNVSTDYILGISYFPEKTYYDIESLGLSMEAAKNLMLGKVDARVINELLINSRFATTTKMMGTYFFDVTARAIPTQNALVEFSYELLSKFTEMYDLPNDKDVGFQTMQFETIGRTAAFFILLKESLESLKKLHWPNLEMAWISISDEEFLKKIGAAAIGSDGVLHPTGAGLLMFGEEYNIVRSYPEYFLDYRELLDPTTRWSDRLESSSGEWTGNLFDFYFRVYNKLIKDVKTPFKMVGGDRVDDTPVHKALREVLANCLVNTDFFVPRGIVIKKEFDTITIENPGSIRVGKYQMREGGESDPRNKALMKMFNLIDIGERAGSGIPELFNVWANEGWEDPIIEERLDGVERTKLTLSFKKKTTLKSDDKKPTIKSDDKKATTKTQVQKQTILDFMEPDTWYRSKEIMEKIGLKETRTKELLKLLIADGLIEDNGANRNRTYKKK